MVQLKQDPKKSTIMCVLLMVLVVIVVRLGFTSAGAAKARAGQSNPAAVASTGEGDAPSEAAPGKGIKLTRPVVPGQPRITRNIFKLNASLYSSGGPRSSARLTEKDDDAQDDEQKLNRLAIQAEAAVLMLQSTIVGQSPAAIINGRVVRLGRTIGGFTVVAVSAQACVVSKDGVKVTLEMKRWQDSTEIINGD